MSQTKVSLSLRRENSRIESEFDWRLKAPIDHPPKGNSAYFSAEREGYFGRHSVAHAKALASAALVFSNPVRATSMASCFQ